MLVKYFIPEDGDDQRHPNVFICDDTDRPTLSEIRKVFPVPGVFQFRLLKKLGNSTVWMDITDEQNQLTGIDGIFLKVSRISGSSSNRKSAPPVESIPKIISNVPSTPSVPTPKPPKAVPTAKQNSEKLIKFDDLIDDIAPGNANNSSSVFEPLIEDNDLLGIGSNSTGAASSKDTSSTNDLFGLEALQPSKTGNSAMNAPPALATRGLSPMMGGMTSHSPSAALNSSSGYSSQQQPQQRGVMNGGMSGSGNKPMGGGSYDPFNNIAAGLNANAGSGNGAHHARGASGGAQQQPMFGANSGNRGATGGGRGY